MTTETRHNLLRVLYDKQGLTEEEILERLKEADEELVRETERREKKAVAEKQAKKERKARRKAGQETAEDKEYRRHAKMMKTHTESADRLKKMATKLFNMRLSDEAGVDNYYLDDFFQAYVAASFDKYAAWFDYIWTNQPKKKQNYGDVDYSYTKLFEGEYEVEPRGSKKSTSEEKEIKHIQVLYYVDNVGCDEHNDFLLFRETNALEQVVFHIRKVYQRSDYGKKSTYGVKAPNLKWYKDRGYNLSYVESLHPTPLGDSYGDARDSGYVLTVKSGIYGDREWEVSEGVMTKYGMYQRICADMAAACYELKEEQDNPEDPDDSDE